MPFEKGNRLSSNQHLVTTALRRECLSDNMARIRSGMKIVVDRFKANGNLHDGVFIRDTLDGKPMQRMQVDDKQGNALSSLQVMFVQALSDKIAENNQQLNVINQDCDAVLEEAPSQEVGKGGT